MESNKPTILFSLFFARGFRLEFRVKITDEGYIHVYTVWGSIKITLA